MDWHLVSLDSIAPTPWRNGGGTTQELAVFPSAGDWRWRMSVARVEQAGPFSVFEGVERWFAVLAGAGVHLEVAGAMHALTPRSPPLRFDGGAPAHCALIDGATQDFNLMARGGRSGMRRAAGEMSMTVEPRVTAALWSGESAARVAFQGVTVDVAPRTLAWRNIEGGGPVKVHAADGLWMEIAP